MARGGDVGIGAVRAALIVAAVLAFFHAVPAASRSPKSHGRELVAQYQLPADAVARFAALAPQPLTTREQSDSRVDSALWVGPPQQAGAGRNPYTLVVTITGMAKTAGDVGTRWQSGWEVRESALATREVLMPLAGLSSGRVAAGAPVSLTAIGNPVSFRGERQVAPMLSLVDAHNLDISDVHLQVWSGSAPLVAWPALSAPRPALLVVGALCVLLWFLLKGGTRPSARPAAAVSRRLPTNAPPLPVRAVNADRLTPAVVAAPAAVPPPNQALRVVAALRDVLTMGLAVPTEYDTTRRPRG
jgi:hypothetical protein